MWDLRAYLFDPPFLAGMLGNRCSRLWDDTQLEKSVLESAVLFNDAFASAPETFGRFTGGPCTTPRAVHCIWIFFDWLQHMGFVYGFINAVIDVWFFMITESINQFIYAPYVVFNYEPCATLRAI